MNQKSLYAGNPSASLKRLMRLNRKMSFAFTERWQFDVAARAMNAAFAECPCGYGVRGHCDRTTLCSFERLSMAWMNLALSISRLLLRLLPKRVREWF